ncbi:MAG: TlpA family protein disulfide reductase [Saprospiraceae bacterium]
MSCSVNSVSILYDVAPLAANYMPIVLQENAVLEITAQAAQFQATFEIKHPAWCAPCRRENRAVLNPIWTKYKNSELQIIGYSIDSSPNAWKAAIDKDGASWPHASHLSGDATPFMTALRITTIPANFILNAQGKVIAKNLHGEALRIFIEDYLK